MGNTAIFSSTLIVLAATRRQDDVNAVSAKLRNERGDHTLYTAIALRRHREPRTRVDQNDARHGGSSLTLAVRDGLLVSKHMDARYSHNGTWAACELSTRNSSPGGIEWIRDFARRWIDAWNSHEVNRLLALCPRTSSTAMTPGPSRCEDTQTYVNSWE